MEDHSVSSEDSFISSVLSESADMSTYPLLESSSSFSVLNLDRVVPLDPNPGPQKKAKKIGRKMSHCVRILKNFCRSRGTKETPKREYLNACLIRGIKKLFRGVEKDKMPGKKGIAIDASNKEHRWYWNTIKEIYYGDVENGKKIADTNKAPGPGEKKKKKQKSEGMRAKSFNNRFCKEFFRMEQVREVFKIMLQILFFSMKPNVLCSKFAFNCCEKGENDRHGAKCSKVWEDFKIYLQYFYLEDIDKTVNMV
jgi:hypothetical protein